MSKNKAFTISEVLIAVTIIGIVAAITIPAVQNNYLKRELRTSFLKTFRDLNAFATKFYADENRSFSEACTSLKTSTKCLNKFMTYFTEVERIDRATYQSDFDYTLHLMNGTKVSQQVGYTTTICQDANLVLDSGGRFFRFHSPSNNKPGTEGYGPNGPRVCVDINGKKGPNKFGWDYFIFMFTVDNKVIPFGQEDPNNPKCSYWGGNCYYGVKNYCDKTFNAYHNISCSYYALLNQHPTKPNQRYWEDYI